MPLNENTRRAAGLAAALMVCALCLYGFAAARTGLATASIDPAVRLPAQDEAFYAHSSLRMAERGEWMTPYLLGRYALYKPPLLYWLSGMSARLLGRGPLALRLVILLAAGLVLWLIYRWAAEGPGGDGWAAALAMTALAAAPLFSTFARIALTDMLVCACGTAALYLASRDTRLERPRTFWLSAAAVACGILAKSIAGLLAPAAMVIWLAMAKRHQRPSPARLSAWFAAGAALAAPWFVYQLAVHPHWFWTEFVLTEHLAWGLQAPAQTSSENALAFYGRRLWTGAPVLTAAAAVAAALAMARRGGALGDRERWAIAWIASVVLSVAAFQYRSAAYLLPILPPMTLLAAGLGRRWLTAAAAAAAIWLAPWKLDAPLPTVAELERYAQQRRGRELVIVEPQDQFVSTTLGLPRVRYVYIDGGKPQLKLPLDFERLGILVRAGTFLHLEEREAEFRRRLKEMDLDSAEPLATAILAYDDAEVERLIAARPDLDFYWPARAKWFTGPQPPPKP